MEKRDAERRHGLAGAAAISAATLVTATAGSVSGDFASAWYQALRKPTWQPSGAVIGAVWTVLYTLLSISAVLLWWHRRERSDTRFWAILTIQYLLNFAFTPLFTRLHALRLATLDCALLTVCVGTLIALAWPVRRLAALLLVPYVAWTAFATGLSWRLWQLNR